MHSEDGSEVMATADGGQLTDNYANAWSDFYPSRAGCVYKSGPAWEVRNGPETQGIVRQARAVYRPDIAPKWVSILQKIIACLDSVGVDFTCINPFGWANEGEEEPFCPFLLSVGVMPYSLAYGVAVAAAASVKEILATSGLAEVEVAFVEMVVKHSASGPRLLPLDPVLDTFPEYRKHFSSALGLPIAPLDTPYYEGTGALYFRLSSQTKDIALLTCAHVARPPPEFPDNKGMTRTKNSQPKEFIVALGSGGYNRAIAGMMTEIAKLTRDIDSWRRQLDRIPAANAAKRQELTVEVDRATNRIYQLDEFHTAATKFRSTPELRTVGWVLHSSPIQVSGAPLGYTEDWALIQLDPKMIEETFMGNKIFFGDKFTSGDFAELMYPHHEDRANYKILDDRLLQAFGVVSAAEISNPPHLEANGQQCLIVMKNGGTTGTTVGRANGLESVKRTYPEYGIVKQDSLEIAVVYYGKGHGRFSDGGDSGSIVVSRDGKILGMLNGGAGPTAEIDVTWLTPFHYLDRQIKKKYPDAFLYGVKN